MTLRQPGHDTLLAAADTARIRQALSACFRLLAWAETNCGPQFAETAGDMAQAAGLSRAPGALTGEPLTWRELADKFDISDRTLSDWRRKRTVTPNSVSIARAALFLGGREQEWQARWRSARDAYELLIARRVTLGEQPIDWVEQPVSVSSRKSTQQEAIREGNAREEFARRFNVLFTVSGLSAKRVASRVKMAGTGSSKSLVYVSASSISAWRTGRHLPQDTDTFLAVVRVLNESAQQLSAARSPKPSFLDAVSWLRLLADARATPALSGREQQNADTTGQVDGAANLLLRIYIPSERLYAAEAHRLLSLFRDWLVTARKRIIRQSGYRTASGEVYEFFAEDSVVQTDLREDFDSFSSFLSLCSKDPVMAVDLLASAGLERASSDLLVAKFGKEVRRLQIDLRHERERRILTIRHSLGGELADRGVDMPDATSGQLDALLDRLVPGSSAPESLGLLAASWNAQRQASLTININPQVIKAMESTIIQNVQGVINLTSQAKQLLALVNQFGGRETAALQSAVYEIEDTGAPTAARSAAKRRLKQFLGQLTSTVRDVGVDLLEKYLEHKAGL